MRVRFVVWLASTSNPWKRAIVSRWASPSGTPSEAARSWNQLQVDIQPDFTMQPFRLGEPIKLREIRGCADEEAVLQWGPGRTLFNEHGLDLARHRGLPRDP